MNKTTRNYFKWAKFALNVDFNTGKQVIIKSYIIITDLLLKSSGVLIILTRLTHFTQLVSFFIDNFERLNMCQQIFPKRWFYNKMHKKWQISREKEFSMKLVVSKIL